MSVTLAVKTIQIRKFLQPLKKMLFVYLYSRTETKCLKFVKFKNKIQHFNFQTFFSFSTEIQKTKDLF